MKKFGTLIHKNIKDLQKVDAQHPTVAIMSNNSNQWKNEVVVNELTFNKKNIKNTHKGETQDDEEPDDKPTKQVKTATDLQRLKLEKLLKQPDKPVYIPEKRKERKMPKPPEFIRNTWGSSAGAGSGDFHVYRGVRRREYARQKFLNEQTTKNELDTEYQQKMEENLKAADERTAKKRAKRLKKKQKAKQMKKHQSVKPQSSSESDDEENDEEECEEQDSSSHKIEKNETVHDNSEQLDNSNVSESKPT
ncbi:hypothetical protein EB796_016112 [Bugula neritina]|uniref:Uncharacterized protein n=1 Tax=Bugula neritina TaxID=10212 RepID=A0A7J7JH44_BUGNE|nr:hypothetical protein EB796_016112 [Bugula neritina]